MASVVSRNASVDDLPGLAALPRLVAGADDEDATLLVATNADEGAGAGGAAAGGADEAALARAAAVAAKPVSGDGFDAIDGVGVVFVSVPGDVDAVAGAGGPASSGGD